MLNGLTSRTSAQGSRAATSSSSTAGDDPHAPGPRRFAGGDPRTVGQADVGDDDLDVVAAVDDRQGAGELADVVHAQAAAGEDEGDQAADVRVVVADQGGTHASTIGPGGGPAAPLDRTFAAP
jgi:hypothetical protein